VVGSGAQLALERLDHFARLGEASHLLLREDQLVADGDVEDAAVALDEVRLDAEPTVDLFRQTGGAGVVASGGAVLDGDLAGHEFVLLRSPIIGAAEEGVPVPPLQCTLEKRTG
jgi:hypothetical protein